MPLRKKCFIYTGPLKNNEFLTKNPTNDDIKHFHVFRMNYLKKKLLIHNSFIKLKFDLIMDPGFFSIGRKAATEFLSEKRS